MMHAGRVQHFEIDLVRIERTEEGPESKDDYPLQPTDSARLRLMEFRSMTRGRHGGEVYIMPRSLNCSTTKCLVWVHWCTQHRRPAVERKRFCSEVNVECSEWRKCEDEVSTTAEHRSPVPPRSTGVSTTAAHRSQYHPRSTGFSTIQAVPPRSTGVSTIRVSGWIRKPSMENQARLPAHLLTQMVPTPEPREQRLSRAQSPLNRRNQIEHQRDDRVDGDQLHALVPIRLAVT